MKVDHTLNPFCLCSSMCVCMCEVYLQSRNFVCENICGKKICTEIFCGLGLPRKYITTKLYPLHYALHWKNGGLATQGISVFAAFTCIATHWRGSSEAVAMVCTMFSPLHYCTSVSEATYLHFPVHSSDRCCQYYEWKWTLWVRLTVLALQVS